MTISSLKKIGIEGGTPITILEERPEGYEYGANWGQDDSIVFSAGDTLWQVSSNGGMPQQITQLEKETGEISHRHPFLLPGAKALLFTVMDQRYQIRDAKAVLLDLETGKRRDLIENAAEARYVPTGHIVFVRLGKLMAMPFNLGKLESTGEPLTVLDDVMQAMAGTSQSVSSGVAQYVFAESGMLVFIPGGLGAYSDRELLWKKRSGEETLIYAFGLGAMCPRISPDGNKIAFNGAWTDMPGAGGDCIYVYDILRDNLIKVTPEGRFSAPAWEPDNIHVTFSWYDAEIPGLYRQSWDGSQPMERLIGSDSCSPGFWTPKGDILVYTKQSEDIADDIWAYDQQDGTNSMMIGSEYSERYPALSPDGKWIAYTSNSSGSQKVYIRSFPDLEGPYPVSTDRCAGPAWGIDGTELFYVAYGEQADFWDMHVVKITTVPRLTISKSMQLFSVPTKRFSLTSPNRNYDISNDGRFLLIDRGKQKNEAVTEMIVIQNWFEELKRLVPTGR